MSYDPSNPEGMPPHYPEGGGPVPPGAPDLEKVKQRVQLPAIFLIIVGALNVLLSLACFYFGVSAMVIPPEQFEKEIKNNPSQQKRLDELRKQGWSEEGITNFLNGTVSVMKYGGFGFGGTNVFLTGLLLIIGGVQMLRLHSYGLAVFGSILAAIPCVSCSACCGIGAGVGIWALIVLMNPEVRAAFAAMR
jgi:hypothetical protein